MIDQKLTYPKMSRIFGYVLFFAVTFVTNRISEGMSTDLRIVLNTVGSMIGFVINLFPVFIDKFICTLMPGVTYNRKGKLEDDPFSLGIINGLYLYFFTAITWCIISLASMLPLFSLYQTGCPEIAGKNCNIFNKIFVSDLQNMHAIASSSVIYFRMIGVLSALIVSFYITRSTLVRINTRVKAIFSNIVACVVYFTVHYSVFNLFMGVPDYILDEKTEKVDLNFLKISSFNPSILEFCVAVLSMIILAITYPSYYVRIHRVLKVVKLLDKKDRARIVEIITNGRF